MNRFEEKRQARIERLQERATRAGATATALWKRGHEMASVIPFGQPILVGHHSEGRDRNYRSRIQGTFRKASEATGKASYYAEKVEAAENNTAISSDDPEATVKLREKIQTAETFQEHMKNVNKLLKGKKGPDRPALNALGINDASINMMLTPDFAGRVGYPSYAITNNGANIRTMKQRLELLTARAADETTEIVINGVKIVENVEENRLQMFFDGKPADNIRAELKSTGFRWSPYNGCWQRQRSNSATWGAKRIAENIKAVAA